MKPYLLLVCAAMSLPTLANTVITTPGRAIVGVNAGEVAKRVCYYQDQAYSDGAILQIDQYYIICTAANDFETNGALKWRQLNESSAAAAVETNPNSKPVKRYSTN